MTFQTIDLKHPKGTVKITIEGPPALADHVAETIRTQFKVAKAEKRHGSDLLDEIIRATGFRP